MNDTSALLNHNVSSISNGMKSVSRAVFILAIVLVPTILPLVASAQVSVGVGVSNSGGFFGISFGSGGFGFGGCSVSICGIGNTILYIINGILVPVLFAIAFIVFLWGIAKAYIFSGGDAEARAQGHQLVLWGVVAFAIMLSLWGLVNIVATTFGIAGFPAPPPPRSF